VCFFLAGHRLKHTGDLVLIPQPSDDVNDPLNWPQKKKVGAFIPVVVFSFLGNWCVAGLAIALLLLIEEFGRDLNTTAQAFIEFPTLALGLGVCPQRNLLSNQCRISFGLRRRFMLGNVPLFSLLRRFSLPRIFGRLKQLVTEVFWRRMSSLCSLLVLLNRFPLLLMPTCSFSMNGGIGWEFTHSFCKRVDPLGVLPLGLLFNT
jgi:hypothetical protein